MTERERAQMSRFLTFVLRHNPHYIGVDLDVAGWTSIEQLLTQCRLHGKDISRSQLAEVVAMSPKKRFAISSDGVRIRASQGHSVPVVLGYNATEPPMFLFHGTVSRSVRAITAIGLHRMRRHHVHLSESEEIAAEVGGRRGTPVILRVRAYEMYQHGYSFYQSDNRVWLTDEVPPAYIDFLDR